MMRDMLAWAEARGRFLVSVYIYKYSIYAGFGGHV